MELLKQTPIEKLWVIEEMKKYRSPVEITITRDQLLSELQEETLKRILSDTNNSTVGTKRQLANRIMIYFAQKQRSK